MSFTQRTRPTCFDECNEMLHRLIRSQRRVLGDRLLAMVLQGSFAVGGFDRHSDVDFAAVVDKELPPEQVEQLQQMHRRFHRIPNRWAKVLDGSYWPADILRSCYRRGEDLWYLDNGHDKMVRSDHCNTAVVRWTVANSGIVLFGPDREQLVDPIDTETLRHEIYLTLVNWGREVLADPEPFANRFYQGFIVLNYCRMLRDLRRGRVGSKPDGAAWAKRNLSPGWTDLIDRAWSTRPNPSVSVRTSADTEDMRRTLEMVEMAIEMAGEWYPQWIQPIR